MFSRQPPPGGLPPLISVPDPVAGCRPRPRKRELDVPSIDLVTGHLALGPHLRAALDRSVGLLSWLCKELPDVFDCNLVFNLKVV